MLIDYHTHTRLCNHATGELSDYIERAIELGLDEYGVSEHFPWMPHQPKKMALSYDEVPTYVDMVLAMRERYPAVTIRLGAEMDFAPAFVPLIREHIERWPFDYVIGSIHTLDSWDFDRAEQMNGFDQRGIKRVWDEYTEKMLEMLDAGLFDIIGHLDLIKLFGHRPADPTPYYEQLMPAIKSSGMVVEVNTSGFDRPVGELYPSPRLLEMCLAEGVPITLGSDAHAPHEVGRHYQKAITLLRKIGFRTITVFDRRKRRQVSLG